MSNFTDFHRLGKRGWVPIPCRAIKLGIFLTAKEAKIAKFLYPEAFSHLIADQSIWNEAQKNSEPLSFFAHFASFAVKSKLSLLFVGALILKNRWLSLGLADHFKLPGLGPMKRILWRRVTSPGLPRISTVNSVGPV
jgi:hypothetical protein